ncbi:MAG: Uma2 family endonuclease [Clostridiales bacterium]|nr:Uma2 family endonuclease [Clostridiales bacterium]
MSEISLCASDRRYEKINGKIFMMATPTMNHQEISSNIFRIFSSYLKGKTCRVYDGASVFLDSENTFIPDVLILCDRSKRKADGIHGAPDLVVEILSPSTAKRDMDEKKTAYEKYGVKEFWLIDPDAKSITIHHLRDGSFTVDNVYYHRAGTELEYMPEDDLKALVPDFTTGIFTDLTISLDEVFEYVE